MLNFSVLNIIPLLYAIAQLTTPSDYNTEIEKVKKKVRPLISLNFY